MKILVGATDVATTEIKKGSSGKTGDINQIKRSGGNMIKIIANWTDLTNFVKANKEKKYLLRPIEIYGPKDRKSDVGKVKDIHSITLEVIEEGDKDYK